MPNRGSERSESFGFLEGLPFRVVAFLSLALLPIGLLAMWQTKNLDDTLRARTELSLVALTELAASGERRLIQNAVGSAQSEAVTLPREGLDAAACTEIFSNLVALSPAYSFVGFLPVEGDITCSSAERTIPVDPESYPAIDALRTSSERSLVRENSRLVPDLQLAVLLYPVTEGPDVLGQMMIAIPLENLARERDMDLDQSPTSMVILDRAGEIILAEGEPLSDRTLGSLDGAVDTAQMFSAQRRVLSGRNAAGEDRILTTTTIVPGLAYAVAAWPPISSAISGERVALPSAFLPMLMWFASLFVAYFAVHRLVVGPIQDLRRRMRRFAADRSFAETATTSNLPRELFELDRTFTDMAYDLMDDEARMEDSLREKNVLLKEIHHRVKNNLQMISSIINMQIRATPDQTAKETLVRLRARVLNLATVHRFLYQADNFGRIDVCALTHDLCEMLFAAVRSDFPKADTKVDCGQIRLVPDQAVPLALFIGEVVSQLHRGYSATDGSDAVTIKVDLHEIEEGVARLSVKSAPLSERDGSVDADIAHQLKRGFALQLGGSIERSTDSDGHVVEVLTFEMTEAVPDARDY